jgi:hypothetical protein
MISLCCSSLPEVSQVAFRLQARSRMATASEDDQPRRSRQREYPAAVEATPGSPMRCRRTVDQRPAHRQPGVRCWSAPRDAEVCAQGQSARRSRTAATQSGVGGGSPSMGQVDSTPNGPCRPRVDCHPSRGEPGSPPRVASRSPSWSVSASPIHKPARQSSAISARKPVAVGTVAGRPHHRHDLLDRRRVSGEDAALVQIREVRRRQVRLARTQDGPRAGGPSTVATRCV